MGNRPLGVCCGFRARLTPDLSRRAGDVEVATGHAYNYVTQQKEKVPRASDVLIAGPSCKDLSTENPDRSFASRSRSGMTFGAILRTISKQKPSVVLLENLSDFKQNLLFLLIPGPGIALIDSGPQFRRIWYRN
jgi:site-specific DNA-cytosine methylase